RIGGHGEGGKVFREHFLYWRLMMAAAAVGTGKGAIEQAVERMRTRDAFGGPIGRFTHLQQELAEHTAKLHMLSLLIHQAAGLLDKQKYSEAASLVAMAKAEGVEWALKASDFAMQLFGAEGYTDLTDLGTRVADLQGLRIADGTTHVMRQEVVRQVYGQDFWNLAIGINEP
ncbi:MAG: acyl-CoA dehydrogenase family protein, partial [Pseudobdellovibrionaceae bacterium]